MSDPKVTLHLYGLDEGVALDVRNLLIKTLGGIESSMDYESNNSGVPIPDEIRIKADQIDIGPQEIRLECLKLATRGEGPIRGAKYFIDLAKEFEAYVTGNSIE